MSEGGGGGGGWLRGGVGTEGIGRAGGCWGRENGRGAVEEGGRGVGPQRGGQGAGPGRQKWG